MKNVCNVCKGALNFHRGLKGSKSDETRIMFIAHKPDKRVNRWVLPHFDAYAVTLGETKTGKNMGSLLNYCDLSWDNIYWTNIFKCVLDDRDPTKKEYLNCFDFHLKNQIKEFNPKSLVVFGAQVYEIMFPEDAEVLNHSARIGGILYYEGIQTLIYPHTQKIRPPYCKKTREKDLFNMMRGFLEI